MKTCLSELAMFGSQPAFAAPLYVGRPHTGQRERLFERISEVLDRRWLSNNGPAVTELEARLAQRLGVRHCLMMCNGTIALEVALRATGITGEVIVPSLTFVATVHAVSWLGLTPVFCDVDPETHNLDPRRVEALISPRTTGIIGVHLWGRPCAVEALAGIAERHRLSLIFDAAHALGCTWRGQQIGRFGRAEVFSLHATKFFHTVEGGAITTNDDALANRIRMMRNFGFAESGDVVEHGTNAKMNEFSAAMGLTLLEAWDSLIEHNRQQFERYQTALGGLAGVRLVEHEPGEERNYQYVVLEIDPIQAGLTRDELLAVLESENIFARRYFYPGCHRAQPYLARQSSAPPELPVTEQLVERVLCLPAGAAIGAGDAQRVSAIIRLALSQASAVRQRLAERAPVGATRARAAVSLAPGLVDV
ncbi:MAG: DegT/DnrJ/EryC1/StrS family aminotransferase [Anaerolineales bacterium]|nr:DegT/DnrJ/EryC1/StrS family aminotransferase [Anaerolineales bacterium]